MNRMLLRAIILWGALAAGAAHAQTLSEYVQACKSDLGFTSLPAINCRDGLLFAPPEVRPGCGPIGKPCDQTNDWVHAKPVTDTVDMMFVCRWSGQPTAETVFRAEMIVHNRVNGGTCFFEAKPGNGINPTTTSPTAAGADNYWKQPTDPTFVKCTDCHAAGAIIASPKIAPALARYGLLNNGRRLIPTGQPGDYRAVIATASSPLGHPFNLPINAATAGCGGSCHRIGGDPPVLSVVSGGPGGGVLMPSINEVITQINAQGLMPPSTSDSPYKWLNRDYPGTAGTGNDVETFVLGKADYPTVGQSCTEPTVMEARVAGSDIVVRTDNVPERFAKFNGRDGLLCRGSDQDDGVCNNYRVRYQCGMTLSAWYDNDNPSTGGEDNEPRSNVTNGCGSPGTTVDAIQVGWTVPASSSLFTAYGPKDRLAQFNQYGLVCNNADQGSGQSCGNYVVRFGNCGAAPASFTVRITNAWSGRQLTATATSNNAPTKGQPVNTGWQSQRWTVESVVGTGYVRLKNVGLANYLNVQSQSESATVVTSTSSATAASQQWVIERIPGSSDARLRNVWTGKYLTIGDNSNFAPVLSQGLNTSWTSQRWVLQPN